MTLTSNASPRLRQRPVLPPSPGSRRRRYHGTARASDEAQVRWRGGRRLQLPPGKAAVSDTPVETSGPRPRHEQYAPGDALLQIARGSADVL
jgi:hypothetical protein